MKRKKGEVFYIGGGKKLARWGDRGISFEKKEGASGIRGDKSPDHSRRKSKSKKKKPLLKKKKKKEWAL